MSIKSIVLTNLTIASVLATPIAALSQEDYSYQYVHLNIELVPNEDTVDIGESTSFTLTVQNLSNVNVATNPVITVELPNGVSDAVSPDCSTSNAPSLACTSGEMSPDSTEELTFTAVFNQEGHNQIVASIVTDQPATQYSKVIDSQIITVLPGLEPPNSLPVDLDVVLDRANVTWQDYDSRYVEITTKNLHSTNAAIAPVVEIALPDGFILRDSDFCTESDQLLTCKIPSLPAESEIVIDALIDSNGVALGPATFTGSVSSTQPDEKLSNNEVALTFDITAGIGILCGASNPHGFGCDAEQQTDTNSTNTNTDDGPKIAAAKSGGGSLPVLLIALLFLILLYNTKQILLRNENRRQLKQKNV